MLAIIGYLLGACLATWIIWKSSDRLDVASGRLATHYNLPEIVRGAVVTAIGSSFPELSSVVLATLVHGQFELGVSTIVGSAIFNILVIPSMSVLLGDGRLTTNRTVIYKEAQFYLIAVAILLLTFSLAVIYHRVPGDAISGVFTRGLAAIPITLYGMYLFLQYQDTKDHQLTGESKVPDVPIRREWFALISSMTIVALGVELLIRCAIGLGDIMHTPAFLWGLTVIAAGTSLPDLFISVKASRQGKDVASLSNVLGSNTFDLLIAVPVGVVLGGAVVINFSNAVPMMSCLTVATIAVFVLMRQDLELTRRNAVLLLSLYALFIIWIALESFGLVSLLAVGQP